MFPRITKEETLSLIRVSQGKEPADVVLRGGKVLNVYSGEVLEQDVAIKGIRIAYVGDCREIDCPSGNVTDVSGFLLSPGYFDPHAHTDLTYDITTLAREALPRGTTALFSESRYMGFTLGMNGMELLKMEADALPMKVCFGIPATSPSFPEIEGKAQMDPITYDALIERPEMVSLSEVYQWIQINRSDQDLIGRLQKARDRGKRIEGHLPGASPRSMTAPVIAGVTSDHEALTAEEALHRIRLGLHVMLRHGSIRNDLPALAPLFRDGVVPTNRVMLTPDFMNPGDILQKGYMDYVIRVAIEHGIPPLQAYQMASLNPAVYFHLDGEIGGISPGKIADILLIAHLSEPTPLKVLVNGQWISEGKRLLFPVKRPSFPFSTRPGIDCGWISPGDLQLRSDSSASSAEVPAIVFVNKTVTRVETVRVPVRNGLLGPDPDQLIQKIAMPRPDRSGASVAFVKGFTRDLGAITIGICHDSVLPFVVGSDDSDMALAFRWLQDKGGGISIVHNGRFLFELPFPLGGVASDLPMDHLAAEFDRFAAILGEFKCPLPDPFMTLLFIPFTVLPYVRMTPYGLLDVIPLRLLPVL